MAWYDSGTVKVTANSGAVTGTGTKWLSGARQGEAFVAPDGRLYEVLNIASDTSLTLTTPYRGATAAGQQYALAPMQGYVKELADRAAELLPIVTSMGTAATGTLATNVTDATAGRVARIGDWGLGANAGVAADATILNNTANGFYRSGTGATAGKPVNNSGDGYIKFGWSGAYGTYLYSSPNADKLWYQNVSNGEAKGWRELMIAGQGGIGRVGAGAEDLFPAANLAETGVGGGLYYYNQTVGDASGLPFGSALAADRQGMAVHRMAGTAGGQIVVSGSGRLAWRGRSASTYSDFKEALAVGDLGFGGWTQNVTNATYDRSFSRFLGWGNASRPEPGGNTLMPWCVGVNLAYNSSRTALFYISTITGEMFSLPNPDGTWRDLRKVVDSKNIVGDVDAGSVIATGYNANGKWTRFADGTQVCFSPVMTSNWIDTPSGTVWVSKSNTWTFPIAFLNADNYVMNGSPQDSLESIWLTPGGSRSATNCTYKLNASFRWDVGLSARLVATGRWKA